jgi:hypothetical protein
LAAFQWRGRHTTRWKRIGVALAAAGALGLSRCARPSAPAELEGLWSRSLEACAAGLGVTFRSDAVRARFGGETFVLLAEPHYEVRGGGAGVLVRIDYRLPSAPGGVNAALGRGVIELRRTPAGRLKPERRWFVDLQTGSARAPLGPGALDEALDLGLCPRKSRDGR